MPLVLPRHSVSVAAAIFDDSGRQVLLVRRRDNGHWEPPGGILELDETIEDGLRREVREETGADVLVGPLTGLYKNMSLHVLALVFRCTLASPVAASTEEAERVAWIDLAEVEGLTHSNFAERIRDAQFVGSPAIKHHCP
jgi:8-oxo-dGTP pyrophosphatase MutT (NUDIX family)